MCVCVCVCVLWGYTYQRLPRSPIGEVFRSRLRQFPSLVNCCTIDWFSEWPEEALYSVAKSYISEITEIDEAVIEGLVS